MLATMLPEPVALAGGAAKGGIKAVGSLLKGLGKSDDLVKAAARGKKLATSSRKLGSPLRGESGTALEGFKHTQGGASRESAERLKNTEFWKISSGGRKTPILVGGEDAAMNLDPKSKDIVVKIVRGGDPVVEGGTLAAGKQSVTFSKLKFGAQGEKAIKDAADATVHFLSDQGSDTADFLKALGVEVLDQ